MSGHKQTHKTVYVDYANGLGLPIVPEVIVHAPNFETRCELGLPVQDFCNQAAGSPTDVPNIDAFSTLGTPNDDGTWRAACSQVTSTVLHSDDLSDLGYPGERMTRPCFMGGLSPAQCNDESTGVGWSIQREYTWTHDPDMDGLSNVSATVVYEPQGWAVAYSATDSCPTAPQLGDGDGDGIDDACDPTQGFANRYVGAGAWQPTGAAFPASFGFLDSDSDGMIDGEDLCPARPGGGSIHALAISDWNGLGEQTNLDDPAWSLSALGKYVGLIRRGNICDPYPASQTRWLDDATFGHIDSLACGASLEYGHAGLSTLSIEVAATVGTSDNDPVLDQTPTPAASPRTFAAQTYRCACTTAGDCLEDQQSPCYRSPAAVFGGVPPGRGWIPVQRLDCKNLAACPPYSLYLTAARGSTASPSKTQISWDWEAEQSIPGRFDQFDFVQQQGGLPGSPMPYAESVYEYALWTELGLPNHVPAEGASTAPPDTSPTAWPQAGSHQSPYPDPESLTAAFQSTDLMSGAAAPSRRLRASYAPPARLAAPHTFFGPSGTLCSASFGCLPDCILRLFPYWMGDPGPEGCSLPSCSPLVDKGPYGIDPALSLKLLASLGPTIGDIVTVDGTTGGYKTTAVLPSDSAPWVARSHGAGVLVSPGSLATASATLGDGLPVEIIGRSRSPTLLWVTTGAEPARFAVLNAVSEDDVTVTYDVVTAGQLPSSVTESARVVADSVAGTVSVVDVAAGHATSLDPRSGVWFERSLPFGARDGAAVALRSRTLFVAGGASAGVPTSEVWAFDAFGTSATSLQGFPSRVGALATVSIDGGALFVSGGTDASGATHDDVWTASLFEAAPARLVASDTPDAVTFDARKLFVTGDADGRNLRAWRIHAFDGSFVEHRVTTERGWMPAGAAGRVRPPVCAADDAHGGELCAIPAADTFGDVGTIPCGQTACRGAPGVVTSSSVVPTKNVLAASLDGKTLWVVTSTSIERWSIDGAVAEQRVSIPAVHVADVAAVAGRALVVGDDGARLASSGEAGLVVGPLLPLCGRARRVTALSTTTWAVASTAGITFVGATPAGLVVLSQGRFLHGGPITNDTALVAVDSSGCAAVDGQWKGDLDAAPDHLAVAAIDEWHALVARGRRVLLVDGSDATVTASIDIHEPLDALRYDPFGRRAYGTTRKGSYRPILDLRSGLSLGGEHALGAWVTREDSDDLSVQISNRTATVARVAR